MKPIYDEGLAKEPTIGFYNTYKELKRGRKIYGRIYSPSFYNTYKELKLAAIPCGIRTVTGFYNTYKELKLFAVYQFTDSPVWFL